MQNVPSDQKRSFTRRLMSIKPGLLVVGASAVCVLLLFVFLAAGVRNVTDDAAAGAYEAAAPQGYVYLPAVTPDPQAPSQGFGLYSDEGLLLVSCKTQDDLQWAMDSYLRERQKDHAVATFVTPLTISPSSGPQLGREEALLQLNDIPSTLPYQSDGSESVEAIYASFAMSEAQFVALNGNVCGSSTPQAAVLPEGETVLVSVDAGSLLSVKNIVTLTDTQSIPFETETKNDNTLYKGQTSVKQAGVNGEKTRTTTIVYIDDQQISSNATDYVVTKQPVKKIVHNGTKQAPDAASAPKFQWPLSGTLSSPFGKRWGKQHEGIDLAVSTGTSVKAAAGGKVLRAFNNAGYGLFVEIDHGNGWITRYGHNSSLKVSAGDQVTKGQVIALSGNTGKSTGPHLHFEIRRAGTPVNPLLYLP